MPPLRPAGPSAPRHWDLGVPSCLCLQGPGFTRRCRCPTESHPPARSSSLRPAGQSQAAKLGVRTRVCCWSAPALAPRPTPVQARPIASAAALTVCAEHAAHYHHPVPRLHARALQGLVALDLSAPAEGGAGRGRSGAARHSPGNAAEPPSQQHEPGAAALEDGALPRLREALQPVQLRCRGPPHLLGSLLQQGLCSSAAVQCVAQQRLGQAGLCGSKARARALTCPSASRATSMSTHSRHLVSTDIASCAGWRDRT